MPSVATNFNLTPEELLGYVLLRMRSFKDLQAILDILPEKDSAQAFSYDEVQPVAGGITPKVVGLGSPRLNKATKTKRAGMTEAYREMDQLDPSTFEGKDPAEEIKTSMNILTERLKWREIYEAVKAIKAAGAANTPLDPEAQWTSFTNAKPLLDMRDAKNIAVRAGWMPDTIMISDIAGSLLAENESVMKVLSDKAKEQFWAEGAIGYYDGMNIFSFSAEILAETGAVELVDNAMYVFKRGEELGKKAVSKRYAAKAIQQEMGGNPIDVEVEKHFAVKIIRPWGVVKTQNLYTV